MDIKIEVRTHDEDAFEHIDVSAAIPESVLVAMEGPVIERSADVSTALFSFLLSVATSVPANLISDWIAHLVVSQFTPKAEAVTITIKGGDKQNPNAITVTLTSDMWGTLKFEGLLAKELEIQIQKFR